MQASTGEPGDLVTEECTTATCPWPKQLWLKDSIVVQLTSPATWDLFHYPFDKQTIRVNIPLLEESNFALRDTYRRAALNISLPSDATLEALLGDIYSSDDWAVIHASITLGDEDHSVVFQLRVARNSVATIFKVILPMLANAILVMLSAGLATNARLKVVCFSLIGASAMLNPSFLGLPSTVAGIPFIQSLVLIHMVVSCVLLCYTLAAVANDLRYETRVESEEKKYKRSQDQVFQQHVSAFSKIAERFTHCEPEKEPLAGENGQTKAAASASGFTGIQDLDAPVVVNDLNDAGRSRLSCQPSNSEAQTAMVQLLLSLPALFKGRDPNRPPKIWNPFGELRPGFLPEYNKALVARKRTNRKLVIIVPAAFLLLWVADMIIYFAIVPAD